MYLCIISLGSSAQICFSNFSIWVARFCGGNTQFRDSVNWVLGIVWLMANPSGNSRRSSSINGKSVVVKHESLGAMRHNPGVSMDWSADEQAVLEDGLTKYVSNPNIIRYAKIAILLPNKTVRDVALRCRWMTKKENSKRRKEELNLTKKRNDKKERVIDHSAKSSHFAAPSSIPAYAQPLIPKTDNEDDIPYQVIGGPAGELLKQNAQALDQIEANLRSFQVQENINLFCQARDNIIKIMNELNDIPETMKQMPPIPVTLNEELAKSILPQTSFQMHT